MSFLIPAIAMGVGAAAGLGGAALSADASKDAASKSAKAVNAASQQYLQDTAGQRALFPALQESLLQAPYDTTNILPAYSKAFENMWGYMPQTPDLVDDVDYDFDTDPYSQLKKDALMRSLNRRYAAGGKAYSSDADNAITRNMSDLWESGYARKAADVDRINQNAMAEYGLGTDDWSRRYQSIIDLFNLQKNINDTAFGQRYNLATLGTNAASQAGNALMSGAGQLSSIYQNNANNLVNAYGQAANTLQDAGAAALSYDYQQDLLEGLKNGSIKLG